MTSEVEVRGVDNLKAGLQQVQKDVDRLAPQKAADMMLEASKARAPVRSGQLRASGEAVPGGVQFHAPYAAPIHWGWQSRNIQPTLFALKGIQETQDAWLEVYRDDLQHSLDQVKGI